MPTAPASATAYARPRTRIRLAQEASVEFAPAMLAAWEATGEDGTGRSRLLVHFFGLFGPDGPLPLHLTEYARDRLRNERDPTLQRFADLFHHRALSLLYRAWADVRPTDQLRSPRQSDRFSTYVGALAGLGTESLRDRDAMPDLTKLHFAGLLANQTRHADGLAAILSSFFTMPVQVECFIGSMGCACSRAGPHPPLWRRRTGPGRGQYDRRRRFAGRRGSGAGSTNSGWCFGPLIPAEDYERLLPGGASFHKLVPIVRNYAGDVLAWDVLLRAATAAEVPDTRLGRQGRLGWTTWLKPRRDTCATRRTCVLDAGADSMAQPRSIATDNDARPRKGDGMTEISRSDAVRQAEPGGVSRRRGRHRILQIARQSRMSSWCIGCIRSCRCRIPTCTGSSGISNWMPSRLAADIHGSAGQAAPGRHRRSAISRPHIEDDD